MSESTEQFRGVVKRGTKRASALGYPTINISLSDKTVSGIFAARVEVEGKSYQAAAFADPTRAILEAYLLDFLPRDLYGKETTINLLKKLRDSEQFTDDALLKSAIANDAQVVREYFASEGKSS